MKNLYITWHYTTHGIAFLKHILSEFYLLEKIPSTISLGELNQSKLDEVFGKPIKKGGFTFDEIVYLIGKQEAHDKISSRRFSHRRSALEDPILKQSKLIKFYSDILEKFSEHSLEKEIQFLTDYDQSLLPEYLRLIWRNIQHYPLEQQIKWLTEYSNFKNVYSSRLKIIELDIDNLRDEKMIAEKVSQWTGKYFEKQKDVQPFINVALGSSETQVVWYILAESGQLPKETRFIKTYDDKNNNPEERFKNFIIQEVSTNLISKISSEFPIYTETKSPSRELVKKKMRFFLDSGFAILMLGERGTGKSKLVREAKSELERRSKEHNQKSTPFIEVNCASFLSDQIALTELFGYAPGTFSDQIKAGKKGLLEEANGGVCFLDEMHHLSKHVQAQLMKAIQTDEKNTMRIRRVGSSEETPIEVKLIFATNKSIADLKEGDNELLPDFYDRIVQHVIHIPPLRETVEDRIADWMNVWRGLFEMKTPYPPPPLEEELQMWLRKQPLHGNFRDLQKIAMYYNIYTEFDAETKKMIDADTAFMYAKSEFEKYHSAIAEDKKGKWNFNSNQTTVEMKADFLFALQDWAVQKFGGRKKAVEHFRSLGDTVSEATFYDWLTKDSLKKKKN